jgi:flagellar hook-length control protein FliK
MAINLLGNFNINNNSFNTSAGESVDGKIAQQLQQINNNQLLSQIRSLLPGQTLEGQLVEQDGKAVQLLLNNNLLLNTTLDSGANLTTGQNISFEVKSNKDGQLVLRPLHMNVSNEATAVKALESASVKVSEETIKMVDSLMKEGMPINKETLQSMNRDINLFPQANIDDIVMLHKLNLPVNESNIEQMHLYNNNNQWMLQNVNNMSNDIVSLLEESSNQPDALKELVQELENVFGNDEKSSEEAVNTEKSLNNSLIQQNASDGKVIIREEEIIDKEVQSSDKNAISKSGDTEISAKNVFDILKQATPEKLKNPEYAAKVKDALTDVISTKLLMEPEKVADKEYVKNYYDKVRDVTQQLEQLLAQNGKADTAFAKDVTQIKSNVDFMNQINELYNYVQLPLKMAGGQANGDLYVYAKKRSSHGDDSDEPLTALLHLSMEALGNMDIFLKLQNEKLSTKFCLEREELIDFVESHIDELNERLIEKGYNIDTSVGKLEDKERTVIDNIKNESPQVTILSTQTFDARA